MVGTKTMAVTALLAGTTIVTGCQSLGQQPSAASGAASSRPTEAGALTAAASGLCAAIAALPDVDAAERAFENEAHAALHALAAAPGLSRELSADVLESMEQVEADFAAPNLAEDLAARLEDLAEKTDAALKAVGQAPPPCD